MFMTIQAHNYQKNAILLDQMFRTRKTVFADDLGWDVSVQGGLEQDAYDRMEPVYLVWCNEQRTRLYGSMRLLPTTGPTLLFDVFRDTFPDSANLIAPGIWEGTRMCIDELAVNQDFPDFSAGRAFSHLFVALCECALDHGIHTMISNYEPHMKRIYKRAGAVVQELGRAEGYGKYPVCCGAFEVSHRVLGAMRAKLSLSAPLYRRSLHSTPSTIPALEKIAA